MKTIAVFCGTAAGNGKIYQEDAKRLGVSLAARNITLIYGGGAAGLMGNLADNVLDNGGNVIGIIPRVVQDKEVQHQGLSELHLVNSISERKEMMLRMADGFIALPGGLGTLDELLEVLAMGRMGLHNKPCGLLSTAQYYEPLLKFFDHMVAENFLKQKHRNKVFIDADVESLLDRLCDSYNFK